MLRQKAGIVNIDFRRAYLYVFDITAVSEALSVKRNTRPVSPPRWICLYPHTFAESHGCKALG